MIVALLLQLSCVTKASRELVEVQLDATQTALSAQGAACYAAEERCAEQLVARGEALAALEARHEALSEAHAQQQSELSALRSQLGAEIAPEQAGRVEQALGALAAQELDAAEQARRLADWQARLSTLAEEGRLEVFGRGADVVVRIPAVQIFNEGRVSVSPRGEVLLEALAAALAGAPRSQLDVVAHTDDAPYHSASFASSWELGFAQAMVLVRALRLDERHQISAGSAAGTQPLGPGADEASRKQSRRLEIIIRPPSG